ncbi:MAG: hypothetical protein AB7E72_08120 [Lysobacterales bacterium]
MPQQYAPGEKERVILFRDFPFPFSTSALPLDLGRGVRLDQVDDIQHAIRFADREEERPRLKAILLQEQLAGVGQVHVCIRTPVKTTVSDATTRLWVAIAAIRLISPVEIRASSILTFDESSGEITEVATLLTMPIVGPSFHRRLNGQELKAARDVNIRLGKLKARKLVRPRSAFTLWAQISGGACTSWQLATLGLVGVLEAVFPQPKNGKRYDDLNYAQRLSVRVARFLEARKFYKRHEEKLRRIYEAYRNSIAHGVHDPSPTGKLNERYLDLLFLHETARLVLLGMLSKSNDDLIKLVPEHASGDQIQKGLDELGPATGKLIGQQILTSAPKSRSLIEL